MRWWQLRLHPLSEQPWALWGKSHATRKVLLLRKGTEVSPYLSGPEGVPATAWHQSTPGQVTMLGTAPHQQQHCLESPGNTGEGIKTTQLSQILFLPSHSPSSLASPSRSWLLAEPAPRGRSSLTLPCTRVHLTQSFLERLKVHRLTQIPSYTLLLFSLCPGLWTFLSYRTEPPPAKCCGSPTGQALFSVLLWLSYMWSSQQNRKILQKGSCKQKEEPLVTRASTGINIEINSTI